MSPPRNAADAVWADAPKAEGPLAGIRVLDLTVNVLGPVSTQILGDMGATVIKVESPQGDQNRQTGVVRGENMGALFLTMNRNKRSVVLNLKRPGALDALLALADTADVLVHSMRAKAAERLGIGYAALAARNPRLIYAFAPGYRQDGPNRDRPAYDDVIQGESGLASLMEKAYGTPRYLPTIIVDKFCGHILASSVGMALFERERSGQGQQVQVPMFETMLSFNFIEHLWMGCFDQPRGKSGYARLLTPHRRPYATRDGHICLMASSDDQWKRLLAALDRPELAEDPRYALLVNRSRHFDELYAIVGEAIAQRTTAEWRQRLDEADIPNGPVNAIDELADTDYVRETGFFRSFEHPSEGPMVTTSIPMSYSRTPPTIRLPAPRLGEHTDAVLGRLGYDAAQIRQMAS